MMKLFALFLPVEPRGKKNVVIGVFVMRDEYDFSDSIKNPYTKKLKKQITIRLEPEVIDYFKELADETGIPYQSLMNLYLQDCMKSKRKLSLAWVNP
jgi:hypothetical protein